MMTPLDHALAAAREDRTRAPAFYEAFLELDFLYVPTLDAPDAPDEPGWREADGDASFRPHTAEHDERAYLFAFSALERLEAWAQSGGPSGYVALPPSVLVESVVAAGGLHGLILNDRTEHRYTFGPDELAFLRARIADDAHFVALREGTSVRVAPPGGVPEGVVPALERALREHRSVRAGYLSRLAIEDEETWGLLLTLEIDEAGRLEAVAHTVDAAVQPLLPTGERLDVARLLPGTLADAVTSQTEPFYLRRS